MPDFNNSPKLMTYTEVQPILRATFDVGVSSFFGGIGGLPLIGLEYNGYGHVGTVLNLLNSSINANPVITTEPNLADVTGDYIYKNLSDSLKVVTVDFDIILALTTQFIGFTSGSLANLKYGYNVRHYNAAGSSFSEVVAYSNDTTIGGISASFNESANVSASFNVDEGEYIVVFGYLYWEQITIPNIGIPIFSVTNYFDNYIVREYQENVPESDNESIFPHEALTRLVQLTTSELSTSNLLDAPILGRTDSELKSYDSDGDLSLLAITNGFNLRGLNRAVNFSVDDLFRSLDALGNIGLWYNNTKDVFEVREKKDYYRNDIILDLGEFEKLEIVVANDLYVNDIKGGCDASNNYNALNGAIEPNGKTAYSTPVVAKNGLDIRSPFNTDTLGITSARGKQFIEEENTDDNEADNTIFITQMKRKVDGFITETGFDFYSISGIVDGEQYYNYRRTSKRNMLINSSRITPSFYKKTGGSINAISTRNDIPLETQLLSTDPVIKELEDESLFTKTQTSGQIITGPPIPTKTLPPLNDPDYYIGTVPIVAAAIKILLDDPHGTITFTYKNIRYYGFADEISTNPFKKGGNVKLIKRHET
jgi:hypothetical protein